MINFKKIIFILYMGCALNVNAENKFESLCFDAMADMTIYMTSYGSGEEINDADVYAWVDENYVYKPLKIFLKKKWLTVLKTNKDFTLNNVYTMKDKYLRGCVAAIN